MIKGQSAIEYLMTYGWMLVAVSIAGGAVYSTMGSECVESTSGFTGTDVSVQDFGVNADNSLDIALSNNAPDTVIVEEVVINDSTSGEYRVMDGAEIDTASTGVVSANAVENGQQCNNLNIQVTYTQGPLDNQVISGTLTTPARLLEIDPPAAPSGLNATY